MHYFCPYCGERHPDSMLRLGLDIGNKELFNCANDYLAKQKEVSGDSWKDVEIERNLHTLLDCQTEKSFLAGLPKIVSNGDYSFPIVPAMLLGALYTAGEGFSDYLRKLGEDTGAVSLADRKGVDQLFAFVDSLQFGVDASNVALKTIYVSEAIAKTPNDVNGNPVLHVGDPSGRFSKVCGKCYNSLFECAGEAPALVIGLLGSSRAGKTTSAMAMLDILSPNNTKSNIFGVKFRKPQHDKRWDTYVQPQLDSYRLGEAMEKSNVKEGVKNAGLALNVTVRITYPSRTARGKGKAFQFVPDADKSLIVTLIDMPGEYMHGTVDGKVSRRWVDDYVGLYKNCDAFWFCSDVGELIQLGARSTEDITGIKKLLGWQDKHAIDVETLGSNLAEMKGKLFSDGTIPPTAFIVTKSDVFQKLLKKDTIELLPRAVFSLTDGITFFNSQEKCLKLKSVEEQMQELRNYFWEGAVGGYQFHQNFLAELEGVFGNIAFFSTSAYGKAPTDLKEGLASKEPEPFRAELPFLWTLAVLGYLPVEILDWQRQGLGKPPKPVQKIVTAFRKGNPDLPKDFNNLCLNAYSALCNSRE